MRTLHSSLGRATVLLVLLSASIAGGCGQSGSSRPDDGKIFVVCTTGQVGDLVRNIGGEHVTVECLMGEGVDPHLYKATPGDRRLLNSADIVFYSGLHLEGRLESLLEQLGRRTPTVAVTQQLHDSEAERLLKVPGSTDTYDPHVWFDVAMWAICAHYTTGQLAKHFPEHADSFRVNDAYYVAQLTELDETCRSRYAEIPKQQRVMVTAHDAFGYLGKAYGLEVHGLQGISTVDEAGLASVNGLVDLIVQRKVPAVFVESSVPARNIQALVEGCRARGHMVTIGGELFSDAMGPAGTPEGTFIGMVESNVETIVEALR